MNKLTGAILFALSTASILEMPAAEKTAVEMVAIDPHVIKDPKMVIDHQLIAIDKLMEMTRQTLSQLQALQELIGTYKQIQEEYLDHTGDKELLFLMAKSANTIVTKAKAYQLEDALDTEFLNEVTMLAQIYQKISLPKLP